MSTKIYDAYVIEKEFSLIELQNIMLKYRDKVLKLAKETHLRMFVRFCTDIYDSLTLGENVLENYRDGKRITKLLDMNDSIQFIVWKYIQDKFLKINETKMRDPLYDYGLEVCIFPLKGKTLFQFFTEKREFLKMWEEVDGVKDYHYQNQTDQPEEVSDEEWEQRKLDWDIALERSIADIPATVGFCFDLINRDNATFLFNSPLNENVPQHYIPSIKNRVMAKAKNLYCDNNFHKAIKKWKTENPDLDYESKEVIKRIKKDVKPFKIMREASKDESGIKTEVEKIRLELLLPQGE